MSTNKMKNYYKKHKKKIRRYGLPVCITLLLAYYLSTFITIPLVYNSFEKVYRLPIRTQIIFTVLGFFATTFITLYDLVLVSDSKINLSLSKIFKISWLSDASIIYAEKHRASKAQLSVLLYNQEGIGEKEVSLIEKRKISFLPLTPSEFKAFNLTSRTHLKLIMSFIIKWLVTGGFFLLLCMYFNLPTSLFVLLILFYSTMFLGYLSPIASGIGLFDLTFIATGLLFGVPRELILLPVITFRLFYFIIPWVATMFILSFKGTRHTTKSLSDTQKKFIVSISIKSLSALTFFNGCILILFSNRLLMASTLNTFDTNTYNSLYLYHLLLLSLGILLLTLSRGIWNKVNTAYYLTALTLFIGTVIFIKEFNLLYAAVLLLTVFLLRQTKEHFYRDARKLTFKSFALTFTGLLSLVILWLYLFNKHVIIRIDLLSIPFIVIDSTVYISMTALISILINKLSAHQSTFSIIGDADLPKLTAFLAQYGGNTMSHLMYLKDKSLFYTLDDQVLISFRAYKNKLFVLGDPIGDPSLYKEAINNFRVFANYHDMIPIFYEVDEAFLPLYHENGFKFLKLGEEAILNLSHFTLVGKKGAALRTIKNKMLRGEFTFELLQPPFDRTLIAELNTLSDAWLEGRTEKGFSLGFFDEDYLNLAPIGIIKQDDTIIAFATIMPTYTPKTIGIDLMRLVPNPPNGTMDALFIGLIEWAIDEGYESFILGKAPLSNVGENQFSPTKEKIAKYIYQYGSRIYSFKGLRRYKEKFHPQWRGIYLAYPKHINLTAAILQLTRMVGGSSETDTDDTEKAPTPKA